MNRLLLLAAGFVLVASAPMAQTYVAPMLGANEVPAVTTPASGAVVTTLQPDGVTLRITGRVDDLSAPITGAHIHDGEPDENGPVIFNLVTLGIFTADGDNMGGRFDGSVTLTAAQAREYQFLGLYVNVHTSDNAGGEIRGQLTPDNGTALILTGAIDGPLGGGTPKAVEIYVREDIADLSVYAVGSANNGGGTDGAEFPLPAVAASAGDYIYVASEEPNFTAWFGFAPDFTSGALSINGDDAIELFYEPTGDFAESGTAADGALGSAAVVDVFGDIDVDGTGEAWDHVDGWAYRGYGNALQGPDFDAAQWFYSGPDALDGETSNATAATPFPTATYLPGSVTADVAGWRLLSPVGGGLTVTDIAVLNLVQGIGAGPDPAESPEQYTGANADVNLFTTYNGTYVPPTSTGQLLQHGRGFFWYFFDADIDPMNEPFGRSVSRDMSGFYLPIIGAPLETDVSHTFPNSSDGFYMLGNPFQDALGLFAGSLADPTDGAIGTSIGAIQNTVFAYDPTAAGGVGDYVELNFAQEFPDFIQPWQGIFAEILDGGNPVSGSPEITYEFASAFASQNGVAFAPFYGRRAPRPEVALRLDGTLASGAAVADHVAKLRVVPGASEEWDLDDLSEVAPPYPAQARLGIGGVRNGELRAQGIRSIPEDIGSGLTAPVMFRATDAGTFAISWDASELPAGWSATLTDTETGASASLTEAGTLAFTADAGDWATRFQIALATSGTDAETGASELLVGDVYPNPTTGAAALRIRVGQAQTVRAEVYDALGRQVAVAFDGTMAADVEQTVTLGAGLAAGVYVVRVQGADFTTSRRLVVTR